MINPQEKYILCIASLYPLKGIDDLEKILQDLKSKDHKMPIYRFNPTSGSIDNLASYLRNLSENQFIHITQTDISVTEEGKVFLGDSAKISVRTAMYLRNKFASYMRQK